MALGIKGLGIHGVSGGARRAAPISILDGLPEGALTITGGNGFITNALPIGDAAFPGNCLDMTWTQAGPMTAAIDLGGAKSKLYIQFFVSCVNPSTASGYKPIFQLGPNANGSSSACQIQLNHSVGYYRIFGVPNFQAIDGRFIGFGVFSMVGLVVDRVANTCDYYLNGSLAGQKAVSAGDLRYLVFGGNNVSGYRVQFDELTVREDRFEWPKSNAQNLGNGYNYYYDGSLDPGIDDSAWVGMRSVPYDPAGGTNYIDGPKRYWQNTPPVKPGDRMFLKRGTVHRHSAINVQPRIYLPGQTTVDKYVTVGAYGVGADPIFKGGVTHTGIWTLHDAPNNVWVTDATGLSNCRGVFVDETMGLQQLPSNSIAVTSAAPGRCFVDTAAGKIYARLWDDSDPNTHTMDLASSLDISLGPHNRIRDVTLKQVGLLISDYAIAERISGRIGSSIAVTNSGTARFCNFSGVWSGHEYSTSAVGPSSQYPISLTGEGGKAYFNKLQDGYINIQIYAGSKDVTVAYNELKNAIISNIQISGGTDASTAEKPIRIVNNTIFQSGRHITNNPYPLPVDQPGHGVVVQSFPVASSYLVILNNVVMDHYRRRIGGSNSSNCISINNDNVSGEIGNNVYYISPESDANAFYFNGGIPHPHTLQVWEDYLDARGWTGAGGIGSPESGSIITQASPVKTLVASIDSGKWLETDGAPSASGALVGAAYLISMSGITTDIGGAALPDDSRSIGAHEG